MWASGPLMRFLCQACVPFSSLCSADFSLAIFSDSSASNTRMIPTSRTVSSPKHKFSLFFPSPSLRSHLQCIYVLHIFFISTLYLRSGCTITASCTIVD
ncbi:hypothetical protein FB451DRAFT_1205939 [Mycena latifolia]|nr:hypothetical protein FB451DRAFT_1205939 [Mycena latifolia]